MFDTYQTLPQIHSNPIDLNHGNVQWMKIKIKTAITRMVCNSVLIEIVSKKSTLITPLANSLHYYISPASATQGLMIHFNIILLSYPLPFYIWVNCTFQCTLVNLLIKKDTPVHDIHHNSYWFDEHDYSLKMVSYNVSEDWRYEFTLIWNSHKTIETSMF